MTAKWPNAKAALVGFLLGQGFTAAGVAKALNDGTSRQTVQSMRRDWAIYGDAPAGKQITLAFELDRARRAELDDQASTLGISPAEFTRRILVCALDDDLYQAVTDGRFK